MAKKENPRISINALERVAKEQSDNFRTETWNGLEVRIQFTIPCMEMLQMVRDVTVVCFTEDGTFIPEIMDFAVKREVVTRYANFTMPSNLEKQYWLIYNTDVYDFVAQHIDHDQLCEIDKAINRKIKFLCDSQVLAFRAKIDELAGAWRKAQEYTTDILDSISQEDIQSVLAAVSNNAISEERVVNAYMDRLKQDAVTEGGVSE